MRAYLGDYEVSESKLREVNLSATDVAALKSGNQFATAAS